MSNKLIIGVGLAALAAYLFFKKKKPSTASAPAVTAPTPQPQEKSADKRVFMDDAPSPVESIDPVLEPSRPIEQVLAEKQALPLQTLEDVIVAPVEPIPSNPAIVFGGNNFYESGFSQQMTDSMSKDFDFYSNQKVLTESGSMDMVR